MSHEAELPGVRITKEQLQVICSRYYFAGQFVSGKQVLEVGCGPGLGLGYLSWRAERVIGGDYADNNLRLAQRHYQGRVELILLDAHHLPFRDTCFDAVLAMATIIYLELDRFFDECYRVLKKGGTLVFCTPNKEYPSFQPSTLSRNYFSLTELATLLNRHFDARFFGAFSTREESKVVKRRNTVVAKVGKTLALMPGGEAVKKLLGYFLPGTAVLKEEIEEWMVENIPLEPLSKDSPTTQHRVLYVTARSRRT